MFKNKISTVCLNVVKAAALSGIALQPLQPAFAGWNKDISSMDAIGPTELRLLKTRCNVAVRTLLEQKTNSTIDTSFNQKKAKWNQRGTKVVNLLMSKYDLKVEGKKGILLDKQSHIDSLCQRYPEVKKIIDAQQAIYPTDLDTHVMSIFEAKDKVVKVTEVEATPDYLRAMLAESGLSEEEQKRQLSAMMAQMNMGQPKTPIEEEKKTITNNTTLTTNKKEKIEANEKVVKATEVEVTPDYLRAMLAESGLSEEEQKRQLSAMMAQMNMGQPKTPIEEKKKPITNNTTITHNKQEKIETKDKVVKVTEVEVTPDYLRAILAESGLSEEEQKRQLSAMMAQMNMGQPKTPVIETKTTSTKATHTFNIAKEISELEQNMPTIAQYGSFNEKKGAEERLQKLINAQKFGVEAYENEENLDALMPVVKTFAAPKFNVAKEIQELENEVLPFLQENASPQDVQEAQARLEKLKAAQIRGMTTYTNENELG
ncbi:MAG: hypothetical protein H0X26_01580 [Alphaproteobacteria bacterium]|nr:hypothetical protein [Alphaproteobacteria bacterium]